MPKHRIIKSSPDEKGWRELLLNSPEFHLGPIPPDEKSIISLLNIIQISDTHICDAQSPARVEFLDRFADPHNPLSRVVGSLVGTYRAHEMMTVQVLESMLRAVNSLEASTISGRPFDFLLLTGDLTDNAQGNELEWFLQVMRGQIVTPDSGSPLAWEGVGGGNYSPHYWNPGGTPVGEIDDAPRSLYGFPVVPELLDVVRETFQSSGSRYPWLAVHGNHDALLQGTVKSNLYLNAIATGGRKFSQVSEAEALETLLAMREIGPASYPSSTVLPFFEVASDPKRGLVNEYTWLEKFTEDEGTHGISLANRGTSIKFWRKDFEHITIIALDTVNPHGGWQGSIGLRQFEWLAGELEGLRHRYVLITSHHPIQDLFNTFAPDGEERRVGTDEIQSLLFKNPHVILWVAGHTHRNKATYFGTSERVGFWQLETSSLIDWPQQGRIIEILDLREAGLLIASTMLDHGGPANIDLAKIDLSKIEMISGLSRLLSVNDWQRRTGPFSIEKNEGEREDRNILLPLPHRLQASSTRI